MTVSAHQIAATLGGRRSGPNAYTARCPAHNDRSPSLSIRDAGDRVLVKCFSGCTQQDVLDALRARGLWSVPLFHSPAVTHTPNVTSHRSNQDEDARRANYVRAIWNEGVDPRGTLAERYLNGRKLALDADPCGRVLRFHNRCPFGKDAADKTIYVPALIIAFRSIRDGGDETAAPQALHRIGLNPDANKIGKMMLGPVAGSAIKLDADDVEEGLSICECIETGIAIRATGWRPVWALGSAGAIRTFAPIPGVEALTVFADHDSSGTGLAAARECALRWADAGCEAIVHLRSAEGKDFADA